ncbi:hypothetical protein HanPSC8_Chr03g0117831 [Helianthus annuus]|nr:hypothetical protein HanPSC8_Chr03g0117831 [Helianthus annuus]
MLWAWLLAYALFFFLPNKWCICSSCICIHVDEAFMTWYLTCIY